MSLLMEKPIPNILPNILIGIFIVWCVIALAWPALPIYGQNISGLEYQVKAGFIYNFAKFIEWPQQASGLEALSDNHDCLILCIASNNPESNVFFSLNGKKVGGKKFVVRKCQDLNNEHIKDCHILFLDSNDKEIIDKLLLTVKGRHILTVGHAKGFMQAGGMINFFTERGKLRFEVNLDAAQEAGLKLGSQILMSAEIISKGPR